MQEEGSDRPGPWHRGCFPAPASVENVQMRRNLCRAGQGPGAGAAGAGGALWGEAGAPASVLGGGPSPAAPEAAPASPCGHSLHLVSHCGLWSLREATLSHARHTSVS